MQKYVSKLKRGISVFLACLMMASALPMSAMAEELGEMFASSVQYAGTDYFEKPVAGSTGFAPQNLQVTLSDGSKGTLKAGTAFTIVSEEGANWKFKTSEKNGSMEGTVASAKCMINLPDVVPSIEYKILNASSAEYAVGDLELPGVTGQNLYGNIKLNNPRLGRSEYLVPIAYGTAKKWAQVQSALKSELGDGLIFYDGYRPFAVQTKVKQAVDAVENKAGYKELLTDSNGWSKGWFISQKTSDHQRGIAADVGLVSAENSMPSHIHDLSINGVVYTSPIKNPTRADDAKIKTSVKNNAGAMRLHNVCMNAGLVPLASEWWHFNDNATKSVVGDNGGGSWYASECLSVAPEDAATAGGTGTSGSTPGGGGSNPGDLPLVSGGGGEAPPAPNTITMKEFPQYGGTWSYWPSYDHNGQILAHGSDATDAKMHQIKFDVDGKERITFCDDHHKGLGTLDKFKKWANPTPVQEQTPLHFVLTLGYSNLYGTNGKTDQLGASPSLSPSTLSWSQATTQAYVWAVTSKPDWFTHLLDTDATEPILGNGTNAPSEYNEGAAARYRLARERVAAAVGKAGKLAFTDTNGTRYDCSTAEGVAQAIFDTEKILAGCIPGYVDGTWPTAPDGTVYHYKAYNYQYAGGSDKHGSHQGMYVAWPGEPVGEDDHWFGVKLMKTDDKGKPLVGARFAMYVDGKQVAEAESDASGAVVLTANCTADCCEDVGDDHNVVVKELTAPQGYTSEPGEVWSGTVQCMDGVANAALVQNTGKTVENTQDDDDDDDTLEKIDARTSERVGPATFHFEGNAIYVDKSAPMGFRTERQSFDVTTGDNGVYHFQWTEPRNPNYIPPGEYTVTETVAPPGYSLSGEVKHLTLTYDDSNTDIGEARSSGPLIFKNDKLKTLKLIKVSSDNEPLAGAEFDIYKDGKLWDSGVSDGEGIVYFDGAGGDGLEEGLYKIVETKAPEGYLLPTKNYVEVHVDPADLQQSDEIEVHLTNYKYPEIKLIKKARDGGEPLKGATFKFTIDGQDFITRDTDDNGEILITQEEFGDFLEQHDDLTPPLKDHWTVRVQEINAPDGYLIDEPDWQEQELFIGQKLQEFTFTDTKYPEIWVRKLDSETKAPLAGAVFSIEIDGVNNTSMQFETTEEDVTEREGWHKITYEEYNRFLMDHGVELRDLRGYTINVTELHAPQFYNKDRQLESTGGRDYTLTGQLHPGQDHIDFTFYDTHYRSLKVIKIDAETNWELKGARFKLRCISLENQDLNASGSNPWSAGVEREGITNAEGFYVWENLPNGDYELVETAPPQGYHGINDTDSTLRGYWVDTQKSGSREIKITSASGSDGQPGVQNRVIEYTYANEPKSGLKILKQDGVNREPIEGARFRITPLAPLEAEPFEGTTDANGVIVIESDLTNGSYMVEEIYVPAPYNLDKTPQYVEIDGKHDAYSIVFNNYADGYVYVRKLDNITGLPCAGAEFEITTADGKKVDQTRLTDSSGYVKFGPLTPGESYIVTETKAPPGHDITTPNWQSFTVPANTSGWVKELIFKDDPLANLWLRKVDAETGKGLQGAEFKITDGSGKIVKNNLVTDNEGYIKVSGLEKGNYVATEITAPIGYMLPEGAEAETHVYLEYGKTEVILIKNTKPGGLIIRKTDASTREALSGAVFQLYDINDTPIGAPVKTGTDGYARWADLEPGQYQVEEIEAPSGYTRTVGRRKFEVKKFTSTEYEWVNAEEATITIYKRDGETKTPLAGAEFEIRDLNGAVVDKLVTDINGSATSKKLPLGYYQVVETKAPYGYQIVETKSDPVEVKAGTPVVLERVNWSDKTIIIRKRDVNTQQPLQGAWFELQTVDGEILQDAICTDASGVAVTKKVEPGMYYLVETKAPDGYRIIQERILVEVEDGKGKSIDIDNMPETIVQIYKTDAVTGDPIPNTEFALKDKHGKVVEVLMTDISGWAYSQPVPAGDYVVEETQAAPGYIKDTEVHHVEVEEGKNFTLMVKNQPGEHITVTKVDATEATGQGAASRKPLAGAVFELQTDVTTGDCELIGTYTTDEYGKFEVEGLAPGFYRLYEITAPDGYEKPEGEDAYTRICVKSGELNQFVIENVKLGTLVVRKVDVNDNKPIAGAVFDLKTVDGDYIGRKETNSNGEITWGNLKSGFYVVTEVIAPDNYDPTQCPSQNVEVKAGKTTAVTFKDEAYGSLVVILQDKHTGAYLEGGQFIVTRLSDMTVVFDGKTDVTGTLVVGNLQPGWYEVTEKFSPDGYTIIESTQKIEIRLGVQQTLYFVNETAGLVIEKVDAQDTKKTLEGARFKVTRVADDTVVGEYVTDKSGTALLSNLTPGYYKVEEVAAPLGYEIDDPAPKQVDIHGGLTAHVTFKDTARASITVNVVDKDTQKGLSQCTVEVWRQNGDKVNQWTSDKSGMVQTEKMTPGFYVLKLVKVTDGYKAVVSEATVELKSGIECTYKFECVANGGTTIVGKDEDGNTLSGVKFRVTTVDGTLIGEYVTGSDGTYDLSGLAPGEYIVTWLSGPVGYEIVTSVQRVTVTANGSSNIEFVHKALSDITVQVLNGTAGMDGCKVEIWLQNGNLVQTVHTDKSGEAKTDKLAPGTYVVKLLSWPDGFKPTVTEKTVTVTYNSDVTVQFSCESAGSLLVKSVLDGKALGGVKFEIRTTEGAVVGSYETDTNGNVTVSGIEPGKYVLVEVGTPDGTNVPEGNKHIDFEVKAGASTTLELTHIRESEVHVKVVDKATQTGVAGVTVEIWRQNADLVKTLVTDATGVLDFGGLANGHYVLKVTGDVSGFEVEQRETTFEVKSSVNVDLTVNMISAGSLTISALDASGAGLAGVTVEIRDLSQTLVGTYVTDATGKYVVTGLKPGTYVVTETACPDGSNIDAATKTTQVKVESGGSITVTLKHISDSVININVVDQKTLAGLQGVTVEIWQQNGSLVNTFLSDATGSFNIGRLPDGNYTVKLVKCIEGYTATVTETVIEVKAGSKIDYTFQCVSDGILRIKSVANGGSAIAGMMFSVTDINGTPIEQNNTFSTGTDGTYVFQSLNPGWYIVTETKAPDGYVVDEASKTQKVEVKAGESIELTFSHAKVFGLQIRTTVQQTGAGIAGASYKITTLEGLEVATVTSNEAGIAFNALQPGWYVVTPLKAPNGYTFSDTTPRNVEVKADGLTTTDFLVTQGSSIRIKVVDGTSGAGIYNVRIQLKNSAGVCIKEYYTNDQGYITLDQVITAGGYTVEMISAPAGYIVDKMPHSLDVQNGATTEIVYKLYKEGGQIQVVVTSSAYNKTLDLPAGTPLQGAVFQIENPDTYQVVGQMISNAQGIAASSALPIGRYTVKMITAPAYYGINSTFNPEVRLKVNNDVVRTETTVAPVNIGAKITQATNTTAKAGSVIRVDMTAANNVSDTRVDNFFVHVKVPTDAARIISFNPGTWTHEVWYTLSYKTNANDYRKLASNLNSGNNYTYDLSTKSLGLMAGEYVTDIRLEFGTVPAGFAVKTKSTYGLYVQGVPNGYKMLVRAEAGGLAGATTVGTDHVTIPDGFASPSGGGQAAMNGASSSWATGTSICTVNVANSGKLPKTGY